MALGQRDLDKLTSRFTGEIVRPDDPGYDAARTVWNSMIDRRPALIVRPTGTDDVVAALRFAREQDLVVAVRCGGHSIPGFSTCDDGIVIDLSLMRGADVDPERRTARVRGGSLLAELDDAAQAHRLVCPVGVVSHTGVAGLTLGGGMGRLQRKLGLTIDSLLAVELVTADGRVVRASEDENPELFWGMRGAGANFGIVTTFEFLLHPFEGPVTHGTVTHPIERADELAERYHELVEEGPDELWTSFGMAVGGDDRGPVASVSVLHSGSPADAERDLAGLRALDDPLEDSVESKPYLASQRLFDAPMEWGQRFSMKSSFLASLPEALMRDWADQVSRGARRSRGWLFGLGLGSRDRGRFRGRHCVHGSRRCLLGRRRDRLERRRARRCLPFLGACRGRLGGAARIGRALRQRRHRGRRRRRAHDLRGGEVRAARRAQARVGPRQRLPAQPEHHALADTRRYS